MVRISMGVVVRRKIWQRAVARVLDNLSHRLKIPRIREPAHRATLQLGPNMNPSHNLPNREISPPKTVMEKLCRHPRVRVVAREEDVEFVECQECGDVFEASEFKDMAIEDNLGPEEA